MPSASKFIKLVTRGSDRMARTPAGEAVKVQVYELAKTELKPEITALEAQGLEGEVLDQSVGKLIVVERQMGSTRFELVTSCL